MTCADRSKEFPLNTPEPNVPHLKGLPLDHIGLAVPSIEDARPLYVRLTGEPGGPTLEAPEQGVNIAFFGKVELLEPRSPDAHVARFLGDREGGLHHLAFQVPDIRAALAGFEADGFELIDREPRMGAAGHPIAFLHPRSTGGVLIELVEVRAEG